MILGTPLDRHLDPGEKLLWSGQPQQGIRLLASDWVAIPFSIFWCGFVFVWEAMALGIGFSHPDRPAPPGFSWVAWIFPLWGIPFILVGLYTLFGRFFVEAARRKKTWYGITDRRLIIYKILLSDILTSHDFSTLTNLQLIERKDNSGDILFGLPTLGAEAGTFAPRRRYPSSPGFYLLPDARQVYNRIREVQQKSRL